VHALGALRTLRTRCAGGASRARTTIKPAFARDALRALRSWQAVLATFAFWSRCAGNTRFAAFALQAGFARRTWLAAFAAFTLRTDGAIDARIAAFAFWSYGPGLACLAALARRSSRASLAANSWLPWQAGGTCQSWRALRADCPRLAAFAARSSRTNGS
jgi:hypothetical protein